MPQETPGAVCGGVHTVAAQLWFDGDCRNAIELYKHLFGAAVVGSPLIEPGVGRILHAVLEIGDSRMMLADVWPGTWERGPRECTTVGFWVYVPECDTVFARAVVSGCAILMPMREMFWGDRMGQVRDPFGHAWSITTARRKLSPAEMTACQEAWMKSLCS